MISIIRDYLTLRANTSYRAIEIRFRCFRLFNNFLLKTKKTLYTFHEINKELLTSYISVIRDNPDLLDYKPTHWMVVFACLRAFYFWAQARNNGGSSEEIHWLKNLKLPSTPSAIDLKTFDARKGPFLRSELLIIDKFFGDMLNNWSSLESLEKMPCIAYVLSRETSRRFSELVNLEVNDFYRDDDGFSYVKLHDRKKNRGGDHNKAHHRISDWIFDFVTMYISDMSHIRENLKTNLLFVHTSKLFTNRKKEIQYITSQDQIYENVASLIDNAALPNRLFFRQDETKLEDIKKPENKKYRIRLNSSRIRDTFGTYMAAIGVALPLIAIRMGHHSVDTTQKYYVVLTEEIKSQYLLEKTGDLFSRMAAYFSNPAVKDISTSKSVLVPEDPDSIVFGGCMADFCNHHPRIACYGCSRFLPLVSPEHMKNLAWLHNRKEEIIKRVENNKGKTEGTHMELILQNLDKAISVCEYIVAQCALHRKHESMKIRVD